VPPAEPPPDARAVIPARFNGPPDSGHGGYSAWAAARHFEGPAEVTLLRPPPLETPMWMERLDDGGVRLSAPAADGVGAATAVLEARPAVLAGDPPAPMAPEEARAVRDPALWAEDRHPFPTCFVCGPLRAPGDGLRLFSGPVGDGRFAVDWTPPPGCEASLVWAALDCPSSAPLLDGDHGPLVLARLAVEIRSLPSPEPHAIVSQRVSVEGRKRTAMAALYDGEGELRALARALWIELR
jgi:hypothetical protein